MGGNLWRAAGVVTRDVKDGTARDAEILTRPAASSSHSRYNRSMDYDSIPSAWASATDLIQLVRALREGVLATEIEQRFLEGIDNRGAVAALVEAGLFGLTLPGRYGGL